MRQNLRVITHMGWSATYGISWSAYKSGIGIRRLLMDLLGWTRGVHCGTDGCGAHSPWDCLVKTTRIVQSLQKHFLIWVHPVRLCTIQSIIVIATHIQQVKTKSFGYKYSPKL